MYEFKYAPRSIYLLTNFGINYKMQTFEKISL